MTTTLTHDGGGRRRYRSPGTTGRFAAPAKTLTTQLLHARDTLPHAGNHRPIRCSDPHAIEIRKAMQQGRSAEFERLLTVAACDLRDGVPFSMVITPFRQLVVQIETLAVTSPRRVRDVPVDVATMNETRAQAKADVRQMAALTHQDSIDAVQAARAETVEHIAKLEALRDAYDRQLAALTVAPLRGTARGTMQVLS